MADNRGRGVARAAPRRARAAATAAACAKGLYDGLHHGMCLLERCVARSLTSIVPSIQELKISSIENIFTMQRALRFLFNAVQFI